MHTRDREWQQQLQHAVRRLLHRLCVYRQDLFNHLKDTTVIAIH